MSRMLLPKWFEDVGPISQEEIQEILTAKRYRPRVEGYREEGYTDEEIAKIIWYYS